MIYTGKNQGGGVLMCKFLGEEVGVSIGCMSRN